MKYGRAAKVATMAIIFIAIVTAMTAIAKTDGDQADARQKTALIDTMGMASSASRNTNTTAAAPEVHGADNWNDVGFTGDGIRVGVIDTDFQGLAQVLNDHHGGDLTVHCYRGRLVPSDRLQDCHTGNDHGTAVVRNLLEMAPDVDLYISDAYSPEDAAKAAEWMADQDVRIISASIRSHWDGPGDGTGTHGWPDTKSLIATAHEAVDNHILWIAPAGNQRTKLDFPHFKRRRRGNPRAGGIEPQGVPACRSCRPTVRNPLTPATGGAAPERWRPRKSATVCRTRPRYAG